MLAPLPGPVTLSELMTKTFARNWASKTWAGLAARSFERSISGELSAHPGGRQLIVIGDTMTTEWTKQAGPEGQAIVDAYKKM